jgi:predicted O-methyltransferase YrrM
MASRSPVRTTPAILALLDRLHALSESQEPSFNARHAKLAALSATDPETAARELDELALDKFVALDRDKCLFVYQLILATNAKTVVEAGTSFGVSTIYLSLAVGENGKDGKVVATEKEPTKAKRAREYWAEAGEAVEKRIDLREGDLLETLKTGLGVVDVLLLDSKYHFLGLFLVCLEMVMC